MLLQLSPQVLAVLIELQSLQEETASLFDDFAFFFLVHLGEDLVYCLGKEEERSDVDFEFYAEKEITRNQLSSEEDVLLRKPVTMI